MNRSSGGIATRALIGLLQPLDHVAHGDEDLGRNIKYDFGQAWISEKPGMGSKRLYRSVSASGVAVRLPV
jgi:hypothetical protein